MVMSRIFVLGVFLVLLTSCEHNEKTNKVHDKMASNDIKALMATKAHLSKFDLLVQEAAQRIVNKDYDKASVCLNVALQVQPSNPNIHFLNGLNYHLQSLDSNKDRYDLAEVGYTQALHFNPHHSLAAQQLGFLYLSQNRYLEAKEMLARCLNEDPQNQRALVALTSASYYAGDLKAANKTIRAALSKEPENTTLIQNAALIHAACGQFKQARDFKNKYEELGHKVTAQKLEKRLKEWERLHKSGELYKSSKPAQIAQMAQNPIEKDSAAGREVTGGEDAAASKRMAIIDVTILKTVESASTRKGVNLLNQLAVNFNAYDLTLHSQSKKDFSTGVGSTVFQRDLVRNFSVGNQLFSPVGTPYTALTYTLNVVNSLNKSGEIFARPTITAIDGKESVFFSGDKFIAGITGALAGVGLDSREVGLQLRVTPHFITDDTLEVDVFAEQDFPDTNISAGFVQLKPNTNILHPLDTTFQLSHNFVRSNVILKFGQSLILSGLTNKVTQTSKDGIPVIQNIPVLQYFASEKTTNEVNNSIVFILTPRRPGFGKYELSQSEKDMLKRGEHLDRYLGRYLNEVKIEPNIHATLASLSNNEYFEEFRLGDVALEDWWHTDNPKFLVEQTLEFMYF